MSHLSPSITDIKKEINQYLNSVSLTPIDFLYEIFQKLSLSGSTLIPSDLDVAGKKRKQQKTLFWLF